MGNELTSAEACFSTFLPSVGWLPWITVRLMTICVGKNTSRISSNDCINAFSTWLLQHAVYPVCILFHSKSTKSIFSVRLIHLSSATLMPHPGSSPPVQGLSRWPATLSVGNPRPFLGPLSSVWQMNRPTSNGFRDTNLFGCSAIGLIIGLFL